jgi:hypothetical protein
VSFPFALADSAYLVVKENGGYAVRRPWVQACGDDDHGHGVMLSLLGTRVYVPLAKAEELLAELAAETALARDWAKDRAERAAATVKGPA